jgi:hypothetical protein
MNDDRGIPEENIPTEEDDSEEQEAEAAEAEAARIGGKVEPLSDDPALEPLEEAGEGEEEGFEQAERKAAERGETFTPPDV